MKKTFKFSATSNGFVYKNQEAFDSGKGICYISEYAQDNELYTQNGYSVTIDEKDIPKVIEDGDAETRETILEQVREVLADYNYTDERGVKALAEYVFNEVDWQYISTYLQEIDFEGWIDYFEKKDWDIE